jgi:hypothetical protein
MDPILSIVIVNFNTCELLDRCLASIHAQTRRVRFEVMVVDNQSSDGSREMLREKHPDVVVIANEENVGFGRANNQGVARSRAPFVMLLNSDACLLQDTGSELVDFLIAHPEAGAVGPMIRLVDGSRQPKTFGNVPTLQTLLAQNLLLCRAFPRARRFAGIFVEIPWARVMEVGWVSGVCMGLNRRAYEAAGGFDPAFFMYAEDIDLCRRLRTLGWKVFRLEDYAIEHHLAASSKSAAQLLRHGVMQQRNLLRIFESTASSSLFLVRAILAIGLCFRIILWTVASLFLPKHRTHPSLCLARACLRDLLGMRPADSIESSQP